MYGDSSSPNYVEHSVVQASTKNTKLKRLAIIAGTTAVFLLLSFIIIKFAKATIIALPMAMVLIVYVAFMFWRYTKVEYEYTIVGGELKMFMVYGGRRRKPLINLRLSTADAIVDYKGTTPMEAVGAETEHRCVSTMQASDIVCIVYKDDNGKKAAVYIEAIKKTKSVLKFYNASAYKLS